MNEQIQARIDAAKGKIAQSGHPNKYLTSKHPLSGNRGKARKGN